MQTPSTKKPRSQDVAKLACVSRATVSYVLNGKSAGLVSEETTARVYAAAREVGYRLNTLAKGLRSGRTPLIGVYCKVREDGFHSRVLNGISDIGYAQGYNILISYLGSPEEIGEENMRRMLDYNVAGVIRMVSDSLTDAEVVRLREMQAVHGIPCVLIDDLSHGDMFDSVVSDDANGVRVAIDHLISLGHKSIGHINLGNTANRGRKVRRTAYVAAMTAAGLPIGPELIAEIYGDAELEAVRQFLDQADRPTAIFCTNDWIAGITREVARDMGIRIPEELAIVGYGNTQLARCGRITSVQEEAETMGSKAFRQLLLRSESPDAERTSIIGATKLIVRESTVAR